MPMPELSSELAAALTELDRSPQQGSLRLRAAALANRLAAACRDPFAADVAETIAAEVAPGGTPALRASLAEQASIARQLRRAGGPIASADASTPPSPDGQGVSA